MLRIMLQTVLISIKAGSSLRLIQKLLGHRTTKWAMKQN